MWYIFGVPWPDFVAWFLGQPLYGQILIIIGIVTIFVLIGIVVYYILKGVAYLIYYILKGIYYLLKYTCIGVYKLFKGLYHLISGKSPQKAESQALTPPKVQLIMPVQSSQKIIKEVQPEAGFCSECGAKFTERMNQLLSENGGVYCVFCGNGFKAKPAGIAS